MCVYSYLTYPDIKQIEIIIRIRNSTKNIKNNLILIYANYLQILEATLYKVVQMVVKIYINIIEKIYKHYFIYVPLQKSSS